MKRLNEAENYVANKRQVFILLLDAIELAHQNNETKIYLKKIKIMEEEVDVVAEKKEWPTVIGKSLTFFEGIEDYEMCQKCKNLNEKIANVKKKT